MSVELENQNYLSHLELQLASTLKPVEPSPVFVHTTRRKFNFASPEIVAQRLTDTHFLFILLASCIGAALFIITGTRMFFYLIGRNK